MLQKRLEWRGIDAEIVDHNPGDGTDLGSGDIFLGGGGQDAGQDKIQEDLQHHIDELGRLVEDGAPMLLICGMYQLLAAPSSPARERSSREQASCRSTPAPAPTG